MVSTLLSLVLLATPAPVKKIEAPKADLPKMELNLPDLPKAEGLMGPSTQQQEQQPRESPEKQANAPKANSSDSAVAPKDGSSAKVLAITIESVTHAADFSTIPEGRRPVGRLDALTVKSLPARTPPFKTCVRVLSKDGAVASMKTAILSPSGEELLASRNEVVFKSMNHMDVVIEWAGLQIAQAGEYKVVININGQQASFPLPVQLGADPKKKHAK